MRSAVVLRSPSLLMTPCTSCCSAASLPLMRADGGGDVLGLGKGSEARVEIGLEPLELLLRGLEAAAARSLSVFTRGKPGRHLGALGLQRGELAVHALRAGARGLSRLRRRGEPRIDLLGDTLAQGVELIGHRQFEIGELAGDRGELRKAPRSAGRARRPDDISESCSSSLATRAVAPLSPPSARSLSLTAFSVSSSWPCFLAMPSTLALSCSSLPSFVSAAARRLATSDGTDR